MTLMANKVWKPRNAKYFTYLGHSIGYTQNGYDFRLKTDIEYDVARFLIMLPFVIWSNFFQTFPTKTHPLKLHHILISTV